MSADIIRNIREVCTLFAKDFESKDVSPKAITLAKQLYDEGTDYATRRLADLEEDYARLWQQMKIVQDWRETAREKYDDYAKKKIMTDADRFQRRRHGEELDHTRKKLQQLRESTGFLVELMICLRHQLTSRPASAELSAIQLEAASAALAATDVATATTACSGATMKERDTAYVPPRKRRVVSDD